MDTETGSEQRWSSFDEASIIVDNDIEYQQHPTEATVCAADSARRRTPWYGTAVLLVSDVMGTGALSLPYAAVTLGWVTTMITILLFACTSMFSGWLLARVKAKHPEFRSFADASTELVGPTFGRLTRICMFVYWGALGIWYVVAAADGIGAIYDGGLLSCSFNRTILAAIVLIIPTQVSRDFHSISKYLSLPSTLCLLAAMCVTICAIVVGNDGSSFGENTQAFFPSPANTNCLDILKAISTILFAYEGQSIYLEVMSEMKDSSQFPKSNGFAMGAICISYALVVVFAYGFEGDAVPGFLPAVLEPGPAKTVVGVLIVIHITVAYAIACQPIHSSMQRAMFGNKCGDDGEKEPSKATFRWLLVTCAFLAFGWVIANLVPFFVDLQGLIGAFFGAATAFVWPPLLFFFMHYREERTGGGTWQDAIVGMGWKHAALSSLFLFVFAPMFMSLGTTGSITTIITNTKAMGTPFGCW